MNKIRITKAFTLILIFVLPSYAGYCKSSTMLQKYIDGIKSLSHNCSMDYHSTATYPGNLIVGMNGRLAMSDGNYYDSSNTRFVMMNKKWLIIADHNEKMINTLYLPEWKEQMGKEYELDISGFLFKDVDLADFSGFDLKPVGKDSFSVHVQYKFDGYQVLELNLMYQKGAIIPSHYSGNVKYPTVSEEEAINGKGGVVSVQFECSNISQQPRISLFDDSRLVRLNGNKAELKRYNNYRMYKKH